MALIQKVEVIPVEFKSTNWDQSTALIKITDENGVYGIGCLLYTSRSGDVIYRCSFHDSAMD